MKSWFEFPGTKFVSLDPVSMEKVENGLTCSPTGVPSIADPAALAQKLIVTNEDIVKNNPYINVELGAE